MSIESSIQHAGYSATVQLSLHTKGETHPLTQVSDRELFFAAPILLNTGPAVVDISVDGKTDSYPVDILAHFSASTRIPIRLRHMLPTNPAGVNS